MKTMLDPSKKFQWPTTNEKRWLLVLTTGENPRVSYYLHRSYFGVMFFDSNEDAANFYAVTLAFIEGRL